MQHYVGIWEESRDTKHPDTQPDPGMTMIAPILVKWQQIIGVALVCMRVIHSGPEDYCKPLTVGCILFKIEERSQWWVAKDGQWQCRSSSPPNSRSGLGRVSESETLCCQNGRLTAEWPVSEGLSGSRRDPILERAMPVTCEMCLKYISMLLEWIISR
jgi:hypothetical protein